MFPSKALWDVVSQPFKRSQHGLFQGKMKQYGNNVPFSKHKTRRTWLPNVQHKRLQSDIMGDLIRVKLTTRALKTIKKKGGLDNYLKTSSPEILGHEGMRLRSIIREEELKKRGKLPANFEIISGSERKSLGMESCVVSSLRLETARLARAISHVPVALVKAAQSSRNLEDTLKSPTQIIGHLLPRHANFRARIQIHQISSVPLVSGEFGVRWKFKGVQSSSAQKKGLLGRVKAKAKLNDKGKGRELDSDFLPSTPNYDVFPITPILAHPSSVTPVEPLSSRLPTDRSVSLSSVETDHSSSLVPSSQSSLTASSQPTLHWADSSSSAAANASLTTMVPDSTSSELPDPLIVPICSTLRRGSTPFLKLKDHSVIWSHTLDTLLKFDIDRETSQIHPNPLKLVVMQRVIPDDPDGSPQNPRLGAVYLNLSEYIGKGSVERKYLLKESKTNSVLKLTIELEYVSGETTYIAPPLPKGEILNEITGFLDNGSVRKRPRALNLYGPYRDQEELEKDLLGTARSGRLTGKFPKSARSAKSQRTIIRKPSNGSTTPVESDSEEEPFPDDMDDLDDDVDLAFDIQRLPHAYGTKTTETIIEALFNPVKISDVQYESPFTIYEPPPPVTFATKKKSMNGIGLGLSSALQHNNNTSINNKRQNSDASSSFYHYSTGSSTSIHTTTTSTSRSRESGSGSGEASRHGSIRETHVGGELVDDPTTTATTSTFGGVRGWWKRHTTTRPESPMTARV